MTVKTTIKFTSDLAGAVDAGIEAVQVAFMRAAGKEEIQELLADALAKLKSVREQNRARVKVDRNPL